MRLVFESLFSVIYLVFAIGSGVILLRNSKSKYQTIIGLSILILGIGDSTHLIPRVIAAIFNDYPRFAVPLGIGKLITSMTMTLFYLLLYGYIKVKYNYTNHVVDRFFYALVILRIILCALPANNWTSIEGNYFMGIIRNIPFALIGFIIISIANKYVRSHNDAYKNLDVYVALSFIFYLLVVLFAPFFPIMGAFMIPKTICYMMIIISGLRTYMSKKSVE